MKKFILLACVILVAGCSYEGKRVSDYIENPKYFIKDPHFETYKEQREDLESQYLKKEITYADYLDQKQALDEKYSQEVQERGEKVAPSQC